MRLALMIDGCSGATCSGMNMNQIQLVTLVFTLLFCVSGCSGEDVKVPGSDLPVGCDVLLEPSDDDQSTLQAAVIEAEENATVCLSAGVFSLQTELAIDRDGLTLRGMGPDVSILDFSGQDVGANGIHVRSDHVTIRELTVSETPGDGIRATDVDDIRFIETHIIWAAPSSNDNGAYGVYPVGSNGVLVDGCRVVGSRDAGIYVGQSTNVLVQNNDLYGNVGGIEIENTSDAEVTKNHSHDNTSGILIFNLPDLPILDGKRTKVHDNVVENNNLPNFADAGTIVAMVPAGSGFIVLASDSNEIHNNVIKNNESGGVIITSYNQALFGMTEDDRYNIYAQNNYVHDNHFENNGKQAHGILAPSSADVVVDGCFDDSESYEQQQNCIVEVNATTFMNIGLCEEGKALQLSDFSCTGSSLSTQSP